VGKRRLRRLIFKRGTAVPYSDGEEGWESNV
jgi:hypothetical protein